MWIFCIGLTVIVSGLQTEYPYYPKFFGLECWVNSKENLKGNFEVILQVIRLHIFNLISLCGVSLREVSSRQFMKRIHMIVKSKFTMIP